MDQLNEMEDDGVGRRGKPTMKEVAACFHLPIEVAAKKLGVGQTWLKLLCRSNGVSRWPYRKIQSLQNSLDRSKKMQSLVEVAKVINKNLPKWLDLEGENPHVEIPDGENEESEKGTDSEEPKSEPDVADDPQPSGRTQSLQDTVKPVASPSAIHSWQLPAKREHECNLRIKVLGGGLDRSESSIASPKAERCEPVNAAVDADAAARQSQWQRVLQGALEKQTEVPAAVSDSTGFGSKTGGAFKPVPQSKPASPPAKMPAPLDLSSFFRVPQPIQLMPFCQDQLPAAFAASLASQPRTLNPYSIGSTQGLEQLLAAAAAAQPPVSHDQRAEPRPN